MSFDPFNVQLKLVMLIPVDLNLVKKIGMQMEAQEHGLIGYLATQLKKYMILAGK